ncbi:MAG: hypothetical protein WAM85_12930 [Terracidiphilus sp.]
MLLVIPCFWQPIVSGADLQSHLYNAWLAQLISRGSIHGLWIAHQSTNILVDMLLSWLMNLFGVSGAERIVAAAVVLIFFWGAFQFISAVRGQPAYWLAPWLAILTYGVVFQIGLLNYYLSCGIVFWLFALLWERRFRSLALWTAPLLILAYLSHPLPLLWFLAVAAYSWLARRVRERIQAFLFLGGVAVLFLIRAYIAKRYFIGWTRTQLREWTGVDQSLLHGWPYVLVIMGFLLFSVILLSRPENRWRALGGVPAQIYFLTAVAITLMPSLIRTSMESAEASLITKRLSLLSGVLLLAVLSRSTYRRWYLPAGLLAAAIFFGALYRDIGWDARVEAKMAALVATLPAGERVVSFGHFDDEGKLTQWTERVLHLSAGSLQSTHLLDRACLGHCFDYMNYEPATGQFRIRATPGNPVVLASYLDFRAMQSGTYVVKAGDLPLYALIHCGPNPGDVVLLPMAEGESGTMLACPGAHAPQ